MALFGPGLRWKGRGPRERSFARVARRSIARRRPALQAPASTCCRRADARAIPHRSRRGAARWTSWRRRSGNRPGACRSWPSPWPPARRRGDGGDDGGADRSAEAGRLDQHRPVPHVDEPGPGRERYDDGRADPRRRLHRRRPALARGRTRRRDGDASRPPRSPRRDEQHAHAGRGARPRSRERTRSPSAPAADGVERRGPRRLA